jgi:hypothetical protein
MRKHSNLVISSVIILIATLCAISSRAQVQAQISSLPYGFSFETNARLGDTNYPEINYIQYFLNQDSRTTVSASGPGSINELTSYFGPKTKDAVSRFQNLYRNEILTRAGLTSATGYWGPLTRAQANRILASTNNFSDMNPYTNGGPNFGNSNYLVPTYDYSLNGGYANTGGIAGNVAVDSGTADSAAAHTASSSSSSSATYNYYDGTYSTSGNVSATSTTSSGGSTSGSSGGSSDSAGGSGITSMLGDMLGGGAGMMGGFGGSSGSSGGSSGGSGGGGGSGSQPFGGKVNRVTECTCSGAKLLDIQDVTKGRISLLYKYGQSKLYMYYNINGTGQQVLGTYTQGGGQCEIISYPKCKSQGNPSGTIEMIGTSQ